MAITATNPSIDKVSEEHYQEAIKFEKTAIDDSSKTHYIRMAFSRYKLAAEKGHVQAQYKVACFYHEGFIPLVKKEDREEYHKFLNLAAEQGHGESLYLLATTPPEAHIKHQSSYVLLLEKAASAGNARAQATLGLIYAGVGTKEEQALGIGVNIVKAIEFLQLSARQGNLEAMTFLGMYYANPKAIDPNTQSTPDLEKARNYLESVARKDVSGANYVAALYEENKKNFGKDLKKAHEFREISKTLSARDAEEAKKKEMIKKRFNSIFTAKPHLLKTTANKKKPRANKKKVTAHKPGLIQKGSLKNGMVTAYQISLDKSIKAAGDLQDAFIDSGNWSGGCCIL